MLPYKLIGVFSNICIFEMILSWEPWEMGELSRFFYIWIPFENMAIKGLAVDYQ